MVLKHAYAFKIFQYNWYTTPDIRLSKQSKLGKRFQKISLQILKTALWPEVLTLMWIKILWLWCQCKWVNSWGSGYRKWHSVTGLVFPDISKKYSASIFKCSGVQAECPVWETCGNMWPCKLSVSCVMMIHFEQCKVKPHSVIHPILPEFLPCCPADHHPKYAI